MPSNFVADGFHTKKLCSRLPSREVQFQNVNGHSACSLAYWQARSGLPVSVNRTFSLDVIAEALRAYID